MQFTYDQLKDLALQFSRSRLFAVATPEAALSVMLVGIDLGLPLTTALRGIHVIENRVEISADLLAALVQRSGACELWDILESTPERCTVRAKRRGGRAVDVTWTLEMARKAGLAGRGNWLKFPHAMLRARAISEAARMVFPDVAAGIYTDGELAEDGLQSTMQMAAPVSAGYVLDAPAAPCALPEPPPIDVPHEYQPVAAVTAPHPLLTEIAAAKDGRVLLALAARVATAPETWAAYAAAWEPRFRTYDAATAAWVAKELSALPEDMRTSVAWESLAERIALQTTDTEAA